MPSFNFRDKARTPFDRLCFFTKRRRQKVHFLTLGTASFINGANWKFRSGSDAFESVFTPHTLIGRFCNLSWNLKFLIGFNHIYQNSVSPYSFQSAKVLRKIAARIRDKKDMPDLTPCHNNLSRNNHYQIILGNDIWMGCGVTIVGGVKIGSGAIIGANSMITKDIPPYAIVGGNPARVIKYRFDEETIKKLMAIKWWNWDIKKILANAYLMDNIEEFLEKHYSPELEKIPENNITAKELELKKFIAEDRKVYSFVGDFHAPLPLWRRIVSGFCKSTLSDAALVIYLDKDCTANDIREFQRFSIECGITGKKTIHGISAKKNGVFSPNIFRNSTHFITTREMVSLECIDCLWDTDVKIVSALDDGIFDGEPNVDWNEIF